MRQLISLAGVLEAEQSALDGEHVFRLPSYHPTFGARRGQIGLRDDIPAHSDEILHAACFPCSPGTCFVWFRGPAVRAERLQLGSVSVYNCRRAHHRAAWHGKSGCPGPSPPQVMGCATLQPYSADLSCRRNFYGIKRRRHCSAPYGFAPGRPVIGSERMCLGSDQPKADSA